jgi:hypothetical protein
MSVASLGPSPRSRRVQTSPRRASVERPLASLRARAMLRRFQFFDKEEIKHDDSGIRVRGGRRNSR